VVQQYIAALRGRPKSLI